MKTAKKHAKKRNIPLTHRVLGALAKHGSGTTDAIARRVRERSVAVSKALSKLKSTGRASYVVHAGEAVWRKGAPRNRATRKR